MWAEKSVMIETTVKNIAEAEGSIIEEIIVTAINMNGACVSNPPPR